MPRDSMTVATSEKMEQTADSEHHQAVTDSTSCKKTQLDVIMKGRFSSSIFLEGGVDVSEERGE